MDSLEKRFQKISSSAGPGDAKNLEEIKIGKNDFYSGTSVDFSHGDVDAFEPVENSLEIFIDGFKKGAEQAYTEYRGHKDIREDITKKISYFTKSSIDATNNII